MIHHRNIALAPLLVYLSATLVLATLVVGCASSENIPPLERRAQEINRNIMCPVCPGESIDQSQHPLAVQMRAIVTQKLEQGWREDRVKEFFVERYGPSVLLQPPQEGSNLFVWIVPPLGLVLALAGLFVGLMIMRRPQTAADTGPEDSRLTAEERARYFPRISAHQGLDIDDGSSKAEPEGPP